MVDLWRTCHAHVFSRMVTFSMEKRIFAVPVRQRHLPNFVQPQGGQSPLLHLPLTSGNRSFCRVVLMKIIFFAHKAPHGPQEAPEELVERFPGRGWTVDAHGDGHNSSTVEDRALHLGELKKTATICKKDFSTARPFLIQAKSRFPSR